MNPRITPKERNLLKGAIRRVFSRSDIRRQVLQEATITYIDLNRPRVKKWGRCATCQNPTPLYLMQVDHVEPIVPVTSSLEAMTWDEVVNRTWCSKENLAPVCKSCHHSKSRLEMKQRRDNKKRKKDDEKKKLTLNQRVNRLEKLLKVAEIQSKIDHINKCIKQAQKTMCAPTIRTKKL